MVVEYIVYENDNKLRTAQSEYKLSYVVCKYEFKSVKEKRMLSVCMRGLYSM